jgi:hypothetical protein
MPFSCQFQCREGNTKEIFSQQVGAADLAVARPLTAALGTSKIGMVIIGFLLTYEFNYNRLILVNYHRQGRW